MKFAYSTLGMRKYLNFHMYLQEGKSEVQSTPVKSDASKMKAQLRWSNVEIGYQYGFMKQSISINSDLKHMTNHVKVVDAHFVLNVLSMIYPLYQLVLYVLNTTHL